jgi:hypothetical protein
MRCTERSARRGSRASASASGTWDVDTIDGRPGAGRGSVAGSAGPGGGCADDPRAGVGGGRSPTAGLRVTAHAGTWAESASTDAEGRFAVPLPDSPGGDSVRVVVDAAETAARVFHPSVASLARGEWNEEVLMVLLPRRWTIRAGTHAGEIVEVSARRGFAPTCRGCSSGFFRRGVPRAWARARAPCRRGARELSAARGLRPRVHLERISGRDSAAFWSDVAELERDLGEHLFRPARFSEADPWKTRRRTWCSCGWSGACAPRGSDRWRTAAATSGTARCAWTTPSPSPGRARRG